MFTSSPAVQGASADCSPTTLSAGGGHGCCWSAGGPSQRISASGFAPGRPPAARCVTCPPMSPTRPAPGPRSKPPESHSGASTAWCTRPVCGETRCSCASRQRTSPRCSDRRRWALSTLMPRWVMRTSTSSSWCPHCRRAWQTRASAITRQQTRTPRRSCGNGRRGPTGAAAASRWAGRCGLTAACGCRTRYVAAPSRRRVFVPCRPQTRSRCSSARSPATGPTSSSSTARRTRWTGSCRQHPGRPHPPKRHAGNLPAGPGHRPHGNRSPRPRDRPLPPRGRRPNGRTPSPSSVSPAGTRCLRTWRPSGRTSSRGATASPRCRRTAGTTPRSSTRPAGPAVRTASGAGSSTAWTGSTRCSSASADARPNAWTRRSGCS